MVESPSFVSIQNVSLDYEAVGFWSRLLGADKQPVSALRHISLDILQGSHITLYGREGSGKTSLLRLLTGVIKPTRGKILVNGESPQSLANLPAGYVSAEESEASGDTVWQILNAYSKTHDLPDFSYRLTEISDVLGLGSFINTPADHLSTSRRLKLNLARAVLSRSPLVLLDDVADLLSTEYIRAVIDRLFVGRVVLIATRTARTADELQYPLILLHEGAIAHHGTIDKIALDTSCPRLVDVWIEGLRYDLLREVRRLGGVEAVRLLPTTNFSGQRLRITLTSSRYLPTMYDLLSQAPLLKVQEIPPSLNDILTRI